MAKVYYSISEICKILDIKPYVLRYWETEFPQLKTKRTKGNTRRYTHENLELLQKIKHLLYEKKYTIAGVKKLFSEKKEEKNGIQKEELLEKLMEIKTLINEMIN